MIPLKCTTPARLAFISLCFFFQNAFSVTIQSEIESQDLVVYENWLSIKRAVNLDSPNVEESIYDRLSEKYFLLYQATNNNAYLNFALHEAGSDKREAIIKELSKNEVKEIAEIIEVLNTRKINTQFYSLHPFTHEDIYKFLIYGVPDHLENQANNLLNHWYETLPETYQKSSLLGAIKAQALVHGYNRLDNFQKVFPMLF